MVGGGRSSELTPDVRGWAPAAAPARRRKKLTRRPGYMRADFQPPSESRLPASRTPSSSSSPERGCPLRPEPVPRTGPCPWDSGSGRRTLPEADGPDGPPPPSPGGARWALQLEPEARPEAGGPGAVRPGETSSTGPWDAPEPPPATLGASDSSFSFIRQALLAAEERGEVEGRASPGARGPSLERARPGLPGPARGPERGGDPAGPPAEPGGAAPPRPTDPGTAAPAPDGGVRPPLGPLRLDSTAPGPARPPETPGRGSSGELAAEGRDPLTQKDEPAPQTCQHSKRAALWVGTLLGALWGRLRGRLEDGAAAKDDGSATETLRQEAEEEEAEALQLQPGARVFPEPVGGQLRGVTSGDAHLVDGGGLRPLPGKGSGPGSPAPAQLSAAGLSRLLHQRQRVQQEMVGLQARLRVLEAQEQRLRRAIADLGWDPQPGLGRAAGEVPVPTRVAPFGPEPPGIKGPRERDQTVHRPTRGTTAKVLTHQELCRAARDGEAAHPGLRGYQAEATAETGGQDNAVKCMKKPEDSLQSLGRQVLQTVREADLEASQLLIREFQLAEGCAGNAGREEREEEEEQVTAAAPLRAGGNLPEDLPLSAEELGGRCGAIREKLGLLEEELHEAMGTGDHSLVPVLGREVQAVKATLLALVVWLQPGAEAGREEAVGHLCRNGWDSSNAGWTG
ncbi:disrupted in schizophrenia 1 protein isoform X1 [Ornithorhynchus anatinus]|uniref:disrupted in schizophrenia 1 protein isoform X1 n=2 Tax=Ornithorhynchus anatinus TaxID=9258 RepID=UPI0010A7D6AF|nr:disrupted in schizophrenia 1 protein isoform X1 [Ornithorhynchus anatinus]